MLWANDPAQRSAAVKRLAHEVGFDLAGIAPALPPADGERLLSWLADELHGGMTYMASMASVRRDPRELLPGARAVVCCAQVYNAPPAAPAHGGTAGREPGQAGAQVQDCPDKNGGEEIARISRYAWGRDYHKVLRRRLAAIARELTRLGGVARIAVDSAPILERAHAARAGLGWIGKNTCLIHPRIGSWLFLGEVVTTLELLPDEPLGGLCGSCRRCLDACPTGALIAPHRLDARRCISYLTIENRDTIGAELARQSGDRVFGCDVCQDVCPYNRKAAMTLDRDLWPRAGIATLSPEELAGRLGVGAAGDGLANPNGRGSTATDRFAGFDELTRGSALRRAHGDGLLRNLLVVVSNLRRHARECRDAQRVVELETLAHRLADCGDGLVARQAAELGARSAAAPGGRGESAE
ncbi:MAG: tRNA epoxyqueuosine(34) reductase QueG [Candidatus Schekmanbacteria bacterium]|nr:tRNA epoxyqueuosine(34) reductase QueG [Candidatus Schekmanbacteria bacterium]